MSEAEVQDAPQQEVEAQEEVVEEYVMPESFAADDNDSIPDYSVEPGMESKQAQDEVVEAAPEESSGEVEAQTDEAEVKTEETAEELETRLTEFRAKAKEEKLRLNTTNELDEYRTKVSTFEKMERLKRDNPLEFIKESGLKFEDLAQQQLNIGEKPTAEHHLSLQEQRLNLLEQQNKDLVQRLDLKEQETQQNHFIGQIRDFVDNNSNYELIKHTDSYESVLREAEDFYKDTGQQLDVNDACKLVTKNLRGVAKKFYSSEALANEFGYEKRQTDDSPQPAKGNGKVIAAAPKTLTNSMTAQPSVEKDTDILNMDKRERIARSARLLQFNE
tara:strand:- start:886 stop:1878 length:993 start_codon:yes stop_codon:yes gene_type:complete